MPDHSLIEEYGSLHSIEEYLRGLVDQGLPDKEGKDKNRYIRSSDFNTVLKGSDAVLQVRFDKKVRDNIGR